ncbi:amidase family protein [Winogradskyella marincola]|uniref:Amidase family protein n=1 Tax=Winogradskyella marincola TaxID=3037795 RepID=A0ABT6FX65_9FLAO|nr:amidase family protein [Winogradskyella sp. YYF002]MDG4714383.1 amidase family protein [Winogradskyella sp. YYF002]
MRYILSLLALLLVFSCKDSKSREAREPISKSETSVKEKDTSGIEAISNKEFREFKVRDSKNLTKADIWAEINPQMEDFTEADYNSLKSYILERDIPTLQKNIAIGDLNYEKLVKFYLYRIRKFDRENSLSLNSVIAINPEVIEQAKIADKTNFIQAPHPVFGMPILLKDNINASGMATTAGAVALKDNITEDAFITKQLKTKGALILGKVNLSEWAYFFCGDCPSGYSAVGGQTLNPYGRGVFDTGGSSSGSGVATSVNFAAATIGSETAGSILSPASQNSVVGLKPTIGLVSRSGIVPISSTLDTAGPITRTVMDNAIILDAIYGYDSKDSKSLNTNRVSYLNFSTQNTLQGKRFGAPKRFLEDSLYTKALSVLKNKGATIVEIEEENLSLPNFLRLLNIDMKKDLPAYFSNAANSNLKMKSVNDVIAFNKKDSVNRMPYGQNLFYGIASDEGDLDYLKAIKDTLKTNGTSYFNIPMRKHNLDGFLSVNNSHAAFAAVAEFPALTVPMGYTNEGEPKGLTFIAKPLQEKQLLEWAYAYEQASKTRVSPKNYN